MGREQKTTCSKCGGPRTKATAYARKNGQLMSWCKRCSGDNVYRLMLKRRSNVWLEERLEQLSRERRFIFDEINRRNNPEDHP